MKRLFISLIVLIPLLCGCTNIETTLTLNNDKSAAVTSAIKFDDDISKNGNIYTDFIKEHYKDFLDDDYKLEIKDKKDSAQISATKGVDNLSKSDLDLSSLGFVSKLENGRFIEVKRNFFVTSYNISMTYDLSKQIEKFEKLNINEIVKSPLKPEYLQKYADSENIFSNIDTGRADFIANFEKNAISEENKNAVQEAASDKVDEPLKIVFNIKVPTLASYNNADKVIGNIYQWDLTQGSPKTIELQYIVYSGFAIGFLIFVGIILLIYLARRILRHDSLKRVGK